MILSIALIGTLGFVFYQNFIQNKNNTSKTDKTKTSEESSNVAIVPPATVVNDFVTSYLSYITSSTAAQDNHNASSFVSQNSVVTDNFRDYINGLTAISSDPIIHVQTNPSGFTIGSVTTTGSSSSVPVTFNYSSGTGTTSITYSLVLVGNDWKIDGVSN